MGIILINIAKCAMTGIEKAMKDMFNIELEEVPNVIREEIANKPHFSADRDECLAFVTLRHEAVQGQGFIAVKMKKKMAKRLLSHAGVLDGGVKEEDIGDALGEFCSLIAGVFKVEMHNLGRGLISISTPKTYLNGIDHDLEGIQVLSHYLMDITHQKEFLMNIELAFHSISFTESGEAKE